MADNYDKCLEIIPRGWIRKPPRLVVKLISVNKRVYEEFGGTKDMKELTVEDVAPIYKKGYWDKSEQMILRGLDLCVFDFGVNAGPEERQNIYKQ